MNNSRKLQLLFGTLLLVVAAVPATLFLTQQNQETRSRASASTKLYLTPNTTTTAPVDKKVGDTVQFDIMVDPGSNLPSIIKLDIKYDPTKLQPDTATPITINTTAFPTTVEGPVVQNGDVLISLSIGSDTTKAIQSVTKVGTVTFKAIGTTTNPTSVSFGSNSQVLSIAQTDQSNENVLSTTSPGYVSIAQSTTISPTVAIATATPIPLATPTTILTPTPTTSLQPTATVAPNATRISFTAFLHGIGNSGDNANPSASDLSNKNPVHQTRDVTVYIYDDQNQLAATQNGTITYNSANGNYTGSVTLGTSLPDGYYTVRIKEPMHLRRLFPGIQHLVPSQDNAMPAVTFVAGDVNNDNTLNILDYNLLVGCYSDLLPAVSCTNETKIQSDLNDDDAVNQFDYNLFLREITVQSGN